MGALRNTQTYYLHVDPLKIVDRSIVGRIHAQAGEEILDLGCGAGGYSRLLMDLGHKVQALDVNPQYVDIARGLGVDAKAYDGAAIPLADGAVDTVILVEVLEHVPQPGALLKEIARVARRNVIITVPNCTQTFRAPIVASHMLDVDHKNFFTAASLGDLLAGTFPRFSIEQVSALDVDLARDLLPSWAFRLFRLMLRWRILRPRFYFRLVANAGK